MAYGEGKGGCSGLGCILIIINKILLALGIIVIILGAIAYWGKDVIVNSTDIYAYITIKLGKSNPDLQNLKLEDLLEPVGIALMALGIVIACICIVGLCGAQHENKCCLLLYAAVVLAIAAAELCIVIAFYGFNSTLSNIVKEAWNKTITDYYAGDDDTSDRNGAISLFWTAVNLELKCCGVDNYYDFHSASNWNRSKTGTTWETPLSCCVQNETFPKQGTPICGTGCVNYLNSTCNYYDQSCYTKVEEYVKTPSQVMLIVAIVMFATEIGLATIAICMATKDKDKGKD